MNPVIFFRNPQLGTHSFFVILSNRSAVFPESSARDLLFFCNPQLPGRPFSCTGAGVAEPPPEFVIIRSGSGILAKEACRSFFGILRSGPEPFFFNLSN